MKTRPLLVILITLIIGFVLGMLTSAQLRFHRLKPMRMFFSEERFREGFYKTVQPDEKQKVKIDLIIDKYAKKNSELQDDFRKELDSNFKDLRKELDQVLTKDQIARLRALDKRREEMIRQNMSRHKNDSTGFHRGMGPGLNDRFGPGDSRMPDGPPPPPSFGKQDSTGSIRQEQ
jgi:hypothetical protein